MTPEITVIILTYNQEHTIAKAIDSVLLQSGSPGYEILIGDDASSDSTREVCRSYAARHPDRIRLMPPAPHKGIVENYFQCLDAAHGRFITDCAGDDYWIHPRKLLMEYEALAANPDVYIAFGGYGHSAIPSAGKADSRRLLISQLTSTGFPPVFLSASMYRREDVLKLMQCNRNLLRDNAFGCEDLPLICALLNAGGAYSIGTETVHYTTESPGITRQPDPAAQVRRIAADIQMHLKLADAYGIDTRLLLTYCRRALRYIAAKTHRAPRDERKALRDLFDTVSAECPRDSMTITALIHRYLPGTQDK